MKRGRQEVREGGRDGGRASDGKGKESRRKIGRETRRKEGDEKGWQGGRMSEEGKMEGESGRNRGKVDEGREGVS